MTNLEKARHNLEILEKEYKPTFKDAVMALRILKATINIRNGTKDLFVINDDIEICEKAIDCIMEDINYDCYLDKE